MDMSWMLLRMILVLGAVCALAYVVLRWGVKRLVTFDPARGRGLEVVERLGIAPKRSLLVVRTGGEYWLVGSSEAGLEMLGKLDAEAWAEYDPGGSDEVSAQI